tara:strand:- start:258 stop:587 length:330 start_codon:yes stop_codon:yes gene_type:complete
MALIPYHNIVGSTTRENELIGVGDIRSNLRSIHLNNVNNSSAATIDLYLYKPSTDTSAEESYFILKSYSLTAARYLTIDDLGLLSFDNSTYALFISVGGSDTVDVFLNR